MLQVQNWAVAWDANRQTGVVDLYLHGNSVPIKLSPPSAAEFSAVIAVLSASKALGRPALWDSTTKVIST